jgi:hypothetical protein
LDDCHQIFLQNGNTARFSLYTESRNIFFKKGISYSKYSRRGTLFIQEKVGSALTETENWDLIVDCTSRDGRQMLDAGVHLSDKRILLIKHFRNNRICCFFTICKSRNGFGRIFCIVFETVCASSLAMCAYQIGEHLHLTFEWDLL